mmetsp:Transcript_90495/g.227619  ORF Transcript_90495/g.227619 Transcript_90495/m.227619 type:complete len:211 (-) Transcript_90495:328-960(-)
MDVTGAWRHIQDKIIELSPICLRHQLRDEPCNHRTAHDSSFARIAEGHHFHACAWVDNGHNMLHFVLVLVHLHLGLFGQADHQRQGRPVDIAIENTNLRTRFLQLVSQIDGDRALTDSALARGDCDDAFHLVKCRRDARHRPLRRSCSRCPRRRGNRLHLHLDFADPRELGDLCTGCILEGANLEPDFHQPLLPVHLNTRDEACGDDVNT